MTNLRSLSVKHDTFKTRDEEALKRLAFMLPFSVINLNTDCAKLPQILYRKNASALQNIKISCESSDGRAVKTLQSISRKFEGIFKHLRFEFSRFYNSRWRQPGHEYWWRTTLSELNIESLTFELADHSDMLPREMPALPESLKQLCLKFNRDFSLNSNWLAPAAGTLEVLCATDCSLRIGGNLLIFPSLKEINLRSIQVEGECGSLHLRFPV